MWEIELTPSKHRGLAVLCMRLEMMPLLRAASGKSFLSVTQT